MTFFMLITNFLGNFSGFTPAISLLFKFTNMTGEKSRVERVEIGWLWMGLNWFAKLFHAIA
jgi:hypothetical protein